MGGHVQLRVVEYFFLEKLFLGVFVHVFFKEVKGGVGLLSFDGTTETLLFLEDRVKVLVVGVVSAALNVGHGKGL